MDINKSRQILKNILVINNINFRRILNIVKTYIKYYRIYNKNKFFQTLLLNSLN